MKLMRNEILFRESYLAIEYNHTDDWLHANWRGYVSHHNVYEGCEKMLQFLKEYKCTKVLNDNTNVEGMWSGAAKWVGEEWFPQMAEAGLQCFAWVYSISTLSRLSTDKSIKHTKGLDCIKTFDSMETAEDWLRLQ